jgi:RNA polymerase-binding transcription factor DksA
MAKSKPAKPAPKAKKAAPARNAKPVKAAKAKSAKTATVAKAAKPVKTTKPAKGDKRPASKNDKPAKVNGEKKPTASAAREPNTNGKPAKKVKLSPFHLKQKDRLLQLRDSLLDAMAGVAKDNLRSRAEGSEASAFGMHQADAGSDAYDRDFALSLLSQEQDALYEIEEALKRLEQGTYGVCEMSGKVIAQPRLEALPFARYTVECQSQIEKQGRVNRARVPVTSLFGLTDEEGGDGDEEESTPEPKEEKD